MPGFVIVLMRRSPRSLVRGPGPYCACNERGLHAEVARDHALVAGAQLAALDHHAAADEQRVDQRARAHHERGHRVGDPRVVDAVDPPQRDVGDLAGLERADLRSRGRGSGRRGWCRARATRGRSARAGRGRPAARRAAPGAARRRARPPRWRRRRRRRARPARRGRPAPAPARSRRRAGRWSSGSARPRCRVSPKRRTSRVVEVHAVREPHVVAEPAELLEVLDRAAAEQLDAEALLVLGLGHVGVQADAARAGQLGRLAHQLLGDAERGARARARSASSRPARCRGSGRSRPRRRRGSRRGPRSPRRAAGRRRRGRGPSSRGTGGSGGRARRATSISTASRSPPSRGKR